VIHGNHFPVDFALFILAEKMHSRESRYFSTRVQITVQSFSLHTWNTPGFRIRKCMAGLGNRQRKQTIMLPVTKAWGVPSEAKTTVHFYCGLQVASNTLSEACGSQYIEPVFLTNHTHQLIKHKNECTSKLPFSRFPD
jgi:hypothetical protein